MFSWPKSLAEQDASEQASGAVVQERSRKLLLKNRGAPSLFLSEVPGGGIPSPHGARALYFRRALRGGMLIADPTKAAPSESADGHLLQYFNHDKRRKQTG